MIIDTTPPLVKKAQEEQRKIHQARSRKELKSALRYYMLWHSPRLTGGDIENLTAQGMDAADAVIAAYPPFNDTRTLATD